MTLSPDRLNEVDEWILDFLTNHEWATPNLMRQFYQEQEGDISRQWISNRLARLVEHDHVAPVKDTSTYQLISDPRETDGDK